MSIVNEVDRSKPCFSNDDMALNRLECSEGIWEMPISAFPTFPKLLSKNFFQNGLILQLMPKCNVAETLSLTVSQTSPGFFHVCITNLLKTLWEKEELLVPVIFVKFEIEVCKLFQLGRV